MTGSGREVSSDAPFALSVVTGGSRGLGFAVAERLGSEGRPVVIIARSQGTLDEAATRLATQGIEVYTRVVDMADHGAVKDAINDIEGSMGPIGTLVNNAGVFQTGDVTHVTAEQWVDLSAVNVTAVLVAMQAAATHMCVRGYGRIVNVSSTSGLTGVPGATAYSATKAAVVGLTRAAAVELARSGVTVNAVAPGMCRTDMTDDYRLDQRSEDWALRRSPMRRWGQPFEVAEAVAYFASHRAGFTTGQVLAVDGGWTA